MQANKSRGRAGRVTEDCFAAVVRAYLASSKFKDLAPASQDALGRYLMRAARPDALGAMSLYELRPSLVQAYIDGMTGKPGKQHMTLAGFRMLEKWAIVRDILPRPITTGVETEESDGGHTPWTDEQVALAEKHARPDLARMVTLGANTGQRRGDLIRMGWSDIERYNGRDGINVTQQKTRRKVWVPITEKLAAAMATWERRPGPFLIRQEGTFWKGEMLRAVWTRHRDGNPALAALKNEGLVIHGLRGHACVRLLRAGANTRQIADMVGMSEPIVKTYTRFSDQRENAMAAIYHLERTGAEQSVVNRRSNAS